MSTDALHPVITQAMQHLIYTAPDETTDARQHVRICEIDLKVHGIDYRAEYRFDLNTGNLRITIAESTAIVKTAELLGCLIEAIGERNAKAN